MATIDDLISKINALAASIGLTVRTKLSIDDAASTYATKTSLGSLAYKSTLAPNDLTNDTIATLKGAKGDAGASITKAELNSNGHLILTIG